MEGEKYNNGLNYIQSRNGSVTGQESPGNMYDTASFSWDVLVTLMLILPLISFIFKGFSWK